MDRVRGRGRGREASYLCSFLFLFKSLREWRGSGSFLLRIEQLEYRGSITAVFSFTNLLNKQELHNSVRALKNHFVIYII